MSAFGQPGSRFPDASVTIRVTKGYTCNPELSSYRLDFIAFVSRATGLHLREETVICRRSAEAMANGHGICHGGFIFALADSAMAFAVNPRGEPAVVQHASISFIRPAQIGDVLVEDATERMHAGRSGIYDVRVSTANGELVAEFRGHSRTLRTVSPGHG